MQNIKYQLHWNDKMQNTKTFRVMFSFIQNIEFIAFIRTFWGLFGFFGLTKMENSYQKFCMDEKSNFFLAWKGN